MSRRCCPGARALWHEISAEMAGELLGSPQAMVRMHTVMLYEACVSVVLLLVQLVIFWALLTSSVTTAEMAILTLLACVPIVATVAKAVALWRMGKRCRQLARELTTRHAAVATGMVRLLQSRTSRAVQGLSLFLVLWYTFCVVWNYSGPPCERYTEFTFELEFWKLTAEQAPCSTWESLCTLLLMFAACDGLTLLWGPTAVHRFQGRFVPAPSQGMPAEALAGLPEVAYGSEGAPKLEDPACAICIEPLKDGEMIRQLPCGHCFHTTCVDSWLIRHASCPMRCPNNELLRAAFGPDSAYHQAAAGGAEAPPPPARWAGAAGPEPRGGAEEWAPVAATLGRPASPREQSSDSSSEVSVVSA